ncbi:dTDP-4-dehydrorhamnose 3,5-epimerase family protein [Microbaculum marinum]|uniref:dTDP-4-dehydrorhamnose 3,5-epimerase n=1 Tax=Microbaculum marinum TaxID=1764581 RepID=A0AAW9RSV6_9HYPH
MRFTKTEIPGVLIVDPEPRKDERGAFNRAYCPDEFAAAGIDFTSTQINIARSTHLHTLRGMHHKAPGMEEAKFVRCTRGAIFDVAVDLRPDSPTYRRWTGVLLDHSSMRGLFIPEGCSHGYLTLAPDTDVLYQMSRPFNPEGDRGVRWDDPAFGIRWPAAPAMINRRDATYPDFEG